MNTWFRRAGVGVFVALFAAGVAYAEREPRLIEGKTRTIENRLSPQRNLGSQSPFSNVHSNRQLPVQRHIVSETRIDPGEGDTVITWPGGFIVRGSEQRRWWPRNVYVGPRTNIHVYSGPQCQYVPGRYEVSQQQVYIPGHWTREYVPPQYERREVNGRNVQVMVREGYYEPVYVPERYETRPVRVWVPAHWACAAGCYRH